VDIRTDLLPVVQSIDDVPLEAERCIWRWDCLQIVLEEHDRGLCSGLDGGKTGCELTPHSFFYLIYQWTLGELRVAVSIAETVLC
jgi:hypothetical protein